MCTLLPETRNPYQLGVFKLRLLQVRNLRNDQPACGKGRLLGLRVSGLTRKASLVFGFLGPFQGVQNRGTGFTGFTGLIGFLGFMGFVGFIGFMGLIRCLGFTGFMGLIGFTPKPYQP